MSSNSEGATSQGDIAFVEILTLALDKLRDTTVNLQEYATEERYRFIDCTAFIDQGVLRILETTVLPADPNFYTTVSYVWFGLLSPAEELSKSGSFRVYCGKRSDGSLREDGGPISIKVLEYACRWSSRYSAPYLWLDRLCILQTSRRDKSWQITRMYDVYEQCQECVVLPGGLQRLASVYEETSWADRAWTYQEAIVTWEFAVVLTADWYRPKSEQHWLIEGECHWQYLHQLFVEGSELLSDPPTHDNVPSTKETGASTHTFQPRLILGRNSAALNTLRRIIEYKAWNHLADEGEEIVGEHTIRQLILQGVATRVSSRPVDMVLSVLGLIGVQEEFQRQARDFGEDDRFAVTLALVETLFRTSSSDDDPDVGSTLIDIPLWCSLEAPRSGTLIETRDESSPSPTNAVFPSLHELVQILDRREDANSPQTSWTSKPLGRWQYDVTLAEDEPDERATTIASELPTEAFLNVLNGETDRVVVHHGEEGAIELCARLDIGKSGHHRGTMSDLCIFGWSMRLQEHPYIRFYRFDISQLI